MLETIYVARHGFRQAFNWPTSPTGTKKDPPLTALGIEQAREMAAYFASGEGKDAAPEMIFSSPYYRCLQTATCTADALDLPIHVEFGISEFYQRVIPGTGLHPRPPGASSLVSHFPRVSIDGHVPILYAPRTGESFDGIHERAVSFVKLFVEFMQEKWPNVKRVLLVSHAATVIALGRALTKDRHLDVRAGTCSLSVYERKSLAKKAEVAIAGAGRVPAAAAVAASTPGGEEKKDTAKNFAPMAEAAIVGAGRGAASAQEEGQSSQQGIVRHKSEAAIAGAGRVPAAGTSAGNEDDKNLSSSGGKDFAPMAEAAIVGAGRGAASTSNSESNTHAGQVAPKAEVAIAGAGRVPAAASVASTGGEERKEAGVAPKAEVAIAGGGRVPAAAGASTFKTVVVDKPDYDIGEWTCVKNGWTGHLKQGEQRHWDFGLEEEMEEAGMGEEEGDSSKSKL